MKEIKRFSNLNLATCPLGIGGEVPPNLPLPTFKDHSDLPPRFCTKCGNRTGMITEETSTGKVLKEIDLCYDCLFKCKMPLPKSPNVRAEIGTVDGDAK